MLIENLQYTKNGPYLQFAWFEIRFLSFLKITYLCVCTCKFEAQNMCGDQCISTTLGVSSHLSCWDRDTIIKASWSASLQKIHLPTPVSRVCWNNRSMAPHLWFLSVLFWGVYVYMCVYVSCDPKCRCLWKPEALALLEMYISGHCEPPDMGVNLGSSARTVVTLNWWPTSLVPTSGFFFFTGFYKAK